MSRIQPGASNPAERPPQKKPPAAGNAPPFTPATARPRQQAAPQSAGGAQPRQPTAKTVRQPRAQAAPDQRASDASTAASTSSASAAQARAPLADTGPNADTRFDGGTQSGQFFGEFQETLDSSGRGGGSPRESLAGTLAETLAALDQGLDSAELARLLPAGGNDGIFDVVLPTGDRLGVVVSGQSSALSYLLSPSTEKFGARLRRQRMELEDRMERLTHRNVNITVL